MSVPQRLWAAATAAASTDCRCPTADCSTTTSTRLRASSTSRLCPTAPPTANLPTTTQLPSTTHVSSTTLLPSTAFTTRLPSAASTTTRLPSTAKLSPAWFPTSDSPSDVQMKWILNEVVWPVWFHRLTPNVFSTHHDNAETVAVHLYLLLQAVSAPLNRKEQALIYY